MKGIFLTVLAFFVASCQMKKYLIEAESAEDADYEITTKHHLGDQKCRIWKERTLKEKCTPGEMYRKWCPEFKKQVADECGESSDYKDSKPKGLKCKKIGDIIKRHCSTPYERKKNKCGGHERSFKKYCGAGGSDYQDSKPKTPNQIRKPKGFCKDGKEIVTMLCSGFEKGRQKCDDLKKSLKKECGSEGGDYLTFNNHNEKFTKNVQNVREGDKFQINNGNVGGNMGQSDKQSEDYAQINTGSVGKNMIQGGNNNHQGNWGNVGGDMVQHG